MNCTLITGASAGIGKGLAALFAKAGRPLVLVARNEEKLKETAAELEATYSTKATIIPMDLARHGAATQLYKKTKELDLEIDILVNNAATLGSGNFHKLTAPDIEQLLVLNITNLVTLTRLCLDDMLSQQQGRILNLSSLAAFQPIPSLACYAASKAFVLSFTEALSEELNGTGISVTALCPGLTDTAAAAENIRVLEGVLGNLPELLLTDIKSVAQSGYDACMQGTVVEIPGVANKATSILMQMQPKWLVRKLAGMGSRWLAKQN